MGWHSLRSIRVRSHPGEASTLPRRIHHKALSVGQLKSQRYQCKPNHGARTPCARLLTLHTPTGFDLVPHRHSQHPHLLDISRSLQHLEGRIADCRVHILG